MPEEDTPTDTIGCGWLAAILCVLAVCVAVIIVTGHGPAVWAGLMAVLWWLFTMWLWFVVGVVVLIIVCLLVVWWLSGS